MYGTKYLYTQFIYVYCTFVQDGFAFTKIGSREMFLQWDLRKRTRKLKISCFQTGNFKIYFMKGTILPDYICPEWYKWFNTHKLGNATQEFEQF
jgi:hypothetical protein